MPDEPADKAEPDAPEPKTDDTPDKTDAPDPSAEAEKWKALARKHEQQAKSNADAAKRLKELEDADKSETEKLNERASAAEKKAEAAEQRALRLEVAADKGLTAKQAARLIGTTKEELEADADELLDSFSSKDDEDAPKNRSERLRGGGRPEDEPEETDRKKLAANVPRW